MEWYSQPIAPGLNKIYMASFTLPLAIAKFLKSFECFSPTYASKFPYHFP
jgi:hypothetical protein